MRKRFSIGEALLYALLTLLALVTLYPLINLVAVSLSPRAEYLRNPMMIFPHADRCFCLPHGDR